MITEFCQRQKRPKAIVQEESCREPGMHRCSVLLPDEKKKEKDLYFLCNEAFADPIDARNYACLLALQFLEGALPLERKLPDPYREGWLSLKTAAPIVTNKLKFACRADQARHEEEIRLSQLAKYVSLIFALCLYVYSPCVCLAGKRNARVNIPR